MGKPPAAHQQPPPPCSQPCPQPWKTLTLSLAPQQTHTCSPTPFMHTRHSHTHTHSPSLTTARVPVLHSAPRTRGWHDLGLPSAGEARTDQAGTCLGLCPLRLLVPWPTSTPESPGGVLGPPRASAGWTLACRGCTTPASELILPPPHHHPRIHSTTQTGSQGPSLQKASTQGFCVVDPLPCATLLLPVGPHATCSSQFMLDTKNPLPTGSWTEDPWTASGDPGRGGQKGPKEQCPPSTLKTSRRRRPSTPLLWSVPGHPSLPSAKFRADQNCRVDPTPPALDH